MVGPSSPITSDKIEVKDNVGGTLDFFIKKYNINLQIELLK